MGDRREFAVDPAELARIKTGIVAAAAYPIPSLIPARAPEPARRPETA